MSHANVHLKVLRLCLLPIVAIASSCHAQVKGSKASDDYVACLIGRAAVALHAQTKGDVDKAQAAAYKVCKPKGKIDEQEGEGISDFVNMMVTKMAQ